MGTFTFSTFFNGLLYFLSITKLIRFDNAKSKKIEFGLSKLSSQNSFLVSILVSEIWTESGSKPFFCWTKINVQLSNFLFLFDLKIVWICFIFLSESENYCSVQFLSELWNNLPQWYKRLSQIDNAVFSAWSKIFFNFILSALYLEAH